VRGAHSRSEKRIGAGLVPFTSLCPKIRWRLVSPFSAEPWSGAIGWWHILLCGIWWQPGTMKIDGRGRSKNESMQKGILLQIPGSASPVAPWGSSGMRLAIRNPAVARGPHTVAPPDSMLILRGGLQRTLVPPIGIGTSGEGCGGMLRKLVVTHPDREESK
jgi:hypothetical protein